MFDNFKSDQLSSQESESLTGGRRRRGRGGRRGFGKRMFSGTPEEKAAHKEKKQEFREALSVLKGGDDWDGFTRLERRTKKKELRQSIFG